MNNNKRTAENFSELIGEINHASTEAASEKLKSGTGVSKTAVFAGSVFTFFRRLFSGSPYNNWGRFYSAFYFSAVRFLTGLKLLKLQNKL
jgi:hypothetical protein